MGTLFIGTSGFNYRDWKGRFYPENLPQTKWLEYYSSHYNTVEINATFYGSFSQKTFQKWASQVPDGFCFTIKGSRFITHIKRLKSVEETINRFFDQTEGLASKLSCILWQFPNSFRYGEDESDRLEQFLHLLPKE